MKEPLFNDRPLDVVIIGGGPAGLMAAEVLSQAGVAVHVFDAMPSVGRKFLLAGKGGMNLTHSEAFEPFASRYGAQRNHIEPLLKSFDATEVRTWAKGLGVDTFVGSSGRVFPTDMKAAPLLRAWLHRLRHPAGGGTGVQFHMRHRWLGWMPDGQTLRFQTQQGEGMGEVAVQAKTTVLALGGGSWARLGSDGAWLPLLAQRGVDVCPLLPSNCGFDLAVGWSEHFTSRHAGQPFKNVAIRFVPDAGEAFQRKGEFVATATGVEGSLVYAASALLRDHIAHHGQATLWLDLLPDWPVERVAREVAHPRGARSLATHLKSRLGLDGIKTAVLYEVLGKEGMADAARLAATIKALPLQLAAARPIDEAISSAGGVRFDALDAHLMVNSLPGLFCAGEMLDWEAPTGGYLLTACLASGRQAGAGALAWLQQG